MNYYHLQLLANDQLADRYAEADRARLARPDHAEAPAERRGRRMRQPRRTGGVLGTLFGRVALL